MPPGSRVVIIGRLLGQESLLLGASWVKSRYYWAPPGSRVVIIGRLLDADGGSLGGLPADGGSLGAVGGRVREVGGVVVGRRPCPRAPMSKHKLTVRSCTAGQVTS